VIGGAAGIVGRIGGVTVSGSGFKFFSFSFIESSSFLL
jgi:hypothetical protein